jgi:hypothetical protein
MKRGAPLSPVQSEADSVARSVAAVDALLLDPDSDPAYEPTDPASASAAIARFAERFEAAEGWVKKVLTGARAGARGLSGDPLQGLSEIVQNADDTGARKVRILLTEDALLAVHDGRRVSLSDVFALATPWVTTKTGDASATGRFGIGLQTLQSLSPILEVASGHYRMRLDDTISPVDEVDIPDGFAKQGDTVFRIPLAPGTVDEEALDGWFARWDDAALLFCRSVRRISLEAGGRVRRVLKLRWEERPDANAIIAGGRTQVRHRVAVASDGRTWAVYTADIPPPKGVHRRRKATADLMPLGVGMPLDAVPGGQIYAGLPVVATRYPVQVNAQFDPLTGRQGLAPESAWNHALCPLVADLWVAAVLDLFDTQPSDAWRVVPLVPPAAEARQSVVARLETLLLEAARTIVPKELTFDVAGKKRPLTELAVEVPRLEGIVTQAEVAELAGVSFAFPRSARDADDRWREVLADWREAGADLPDSVTVEAALALFDNSDRSPDASIALAAAALDEGLEGELAAHDFVITADGTRVRPPTESDPWLLAAEPGGLAEVLGIGRRLHPAYKADRADAAVVVAWLREQGALGDSTDARGVLRRLVAAGQAGRVLPEALTDTQLRALRDAFESLNQAERARYGPGVGRAVLIDAFEYGRRGKRMVKTARPPDTYLPRAIDRDPDSFAAAAGHTPDITWAHWRYADTLRSPLGRAGLGAQRFLRLLGAEVGPRLMPHSELFARYSDSRRGLWRNVAGSPGTRTHAMSALGATYTLDDLDSPDLAEVLTDIGRDRSATRRRERASAMLATLGRAWDRLAEFAEVPAADDWHGWNIKGSTRAFWVWRAATIPWLDDNTNTPRPPAELRLRTPSTVAVHGPSAPGYVHKDIPPLRLDVLAALGVSGEPSTGDLVNRLRELRDDMPDSATVAADAALAYQGLADRLGGRAHVPGDLGRTALRSAFSAGAGLIRTNLGWQRPASVFLGPPVFVDRRAFVPPAPGAERLWAFLQVGRPSVADCTAVLGEIAGGESPPSLPDQTTILETLRLLVSLLSEDPAPRAALRRLASLPVWTTRGWSTVRPVYAVEDPTLADGLGPQVPIWLPGGELRQFSQLVEHLRLTQISAESTTVVDPDRAWRDEEATSVMRTAAHLLREDLARNDPATASALEVGWDRLTEFEVRIAPELSVRIAGLALDGLTVRVIAKAEPDAAVLYLLDPELLARVDAGGRAIAGLFAADHRRVAQAWLAACDAAQAGREAQRLQLAEERAAEEEARAQADIADRLAAFRLQTQAAHATRGRAQRPRATAGAAEAQQATERPTTTTAPRTLVDPNTLRVADAAGRLVGIGNSGSAGKTARSRVQPAAELPAPRSGGAAPQARTTAPSYTAGSREAVGLDLVRKVLASDADEMRDLRAQHGVGADAIDALERFFELKVYAGDEPDRITLEESQIRRAMSTPDFFLVVVSGVESQRAAPRVRVIVDPLRQLTMTESSSVGFTGVRDSMSLVYDFVQATETDSKP